MDLAETALIGPIGSEKGHSHNLSQLEPGLGRRNPAVVYLAGLSKGSRRSTTQALRVVAGILQLELELVPWQELRYQRTQAVRAAVADRYAPATANKILAALRGVLREARRLGQMSAEDAARAMDLRPVRGTRPPRGRALERDELAALRATCDLGTALGVRDLALLSVLFAGGLRRSEAVGLDVADVAGVTATGLELRVRGKGDKHRLVYLSALHSADVSQWLDQHRGREEGPLFCSLRRNGRLVRRRLSAQAVLVVLQKRAAQAGIGRTSPHDARRTFASTLLDRGADIVTVQRMLGHANVTTTARYDRRSERAARAAAKLLDT